MTVSRDQNAGRIHSMKTDNSSIERVEKLKYLGTTLTNRNSIQEEIKSRLKLGNACYYSVQNLWSSRLLSKTLKIVFFVEFSWTYLYQSCPASTSLVKIGCCHILLKDVNDFPTRTVHIFWQILVKLGAREHNTKTSSSYHFPENGAMKDKL